jgi:SAM-dependent methyltransferase
LDARVEKAESLPFSSEFDAVFSNAVLHWVKDQHTVLEGVRRALKPGGRFVGELGGAGNVRAIRSVLHASLARRGIHAESVDPWFFPTSAQYRDLLAHHGLRVEFLDLFPRPTLLPGDLAAWLETFAQPFLAAVGAHERAALIEEARQALRPHLYDPARGWIADYCRLRFAAYKRAATPTD